MKSIHDAIEERWLTTSALIALVPLDQMCVGDFPAQEDDAETIKYPYVTRVIQGEVKEAYTSDRRIMVASVLFNIYTEKHADGQRVRSAFAGERGGVEGFENKDFAAAGLQVACVREDTWSELQGDDGVWQFAMVVDFRFWEI